MLQSLYTPGGAPPLDPEEIALAAEDALLCLRQMRGWPSDKVLSRDPKTTKPVTVADYRESCLQKLADLGQPVPAELQRTH